MRAFWKYDQYPYVLSGTVSSISTKADPDIVETVEYGKGMYFRPMIILPDEEGKEIAEKLKMLKEQYNQEMASLRDRYIKLRNEVAPFMVEPKG
jgi:hypothetical protein